jgi:hypothetical protein
VLAVWEAATVIPSRRNFYVVEDLTDCHATTDSAIYRLVFWRTDMLPTADIRRLADLLNASDSHAIPRKQRPGMAAGLADDDQIPAWALNTSWMLATGRTLRSDAPPRPRAEEELITFWADNQTTVGCIVAIGSASRRAAR